MAMGAFTEPVKNAPAATADRRAAPRFEVISCIQGDTGAGDSVTLVNISEGGALVHSTFPAGLGEVHEFRFIREDGDPPLVFAARVVHVQPVPALREPVYALGLEFVTTTDHQRESIVAVIAAGQPLLH